MINLSLLLSVLVPFTLADMNHSQVLEFINNLSRIKPDLLKPVVNLVLCDESDELIAGALDFHYSTHPHLNIKQMLNLTSKNLDDTTLIFCKIPIQEKLIVNEAFAIFPASAEWVVSRFMMEGEENRKFLVKNNSEIFEIITLKSVDDSITLQLPINHPAEDTRIDLNGIMLTVGYSDSTVLSRRKDDKLEGKIGATFHAMSKIMNFTYKLVPSIDGFQGSKVPGGIKHKGKTSVFNGLIGMLERKEVDIAGSGLFVTFDRTQIADFGGSILRLDTFCFMSRPGNEIDLMAFFKPLNPSIWAWVFCSALGLTLVLFTLSYITHNETQHSMSTPKGRTIQLWRQILANNLARWRRKKKILITVPNQEQNEPTNIGRCVDLLSFSLRALGAVETFLLPETRFKKAWRICMLTYLVLGFFVVETYKAELTSYLTSKTAKLPIQKMEDILDTDIKLSLPSGTSFVSRLQFSEQNVVFQRLWKEKVYGQEYGLITWVQGDFDNILKAVRSNYLVLGYGDEAEAFMAAYPCESARIAVLSIISHIF
ncbi:glutamate receptor 1 isoform X2 [Eurytemora carolleeae]|uniref:glutamate receptor 1 isoform X2 n=1 Tax=Eurytemora carolleeae TaxID=1294199 RepID=UPI000C77A139|nr:glutamate receptor 1 isoform X2 [Eurytemora carolleeae]|eukprot:XP_023346528.1 glutamate receptor 1-like isoform X2 [Eurytemora affinis]